MNTRRHHRHGLGHADGPLHRIGLEAPLRRRIGHRHTTLFDAATFPTTISAEVKDLQTRTISSPTPARTPAPAATPGSPWRPAPGLESRRPGSQPSSISIASGIYLGSGEGSLDFDAYTTAALSGVENDTAEVDTVEMGRARRSNA